MDLCGFIVVLNTLRIVSRISQENTLLLHEAYTVTDSRTDSSYSLVVMAQILIRELFLNLLYDSGV